MPSTVYYIWKQLGTGIGYTVPGDTALYPAVPKIPGTYRAQHCAATVSFLLDCQVSRNSLTYKQLTKLQYAPETEKKKLEKMIRLKQHCSIMGSSFDHFDVQVHSNRDNQSRRLKIIDEVHIRSGDG